MSGLEYDLNAGKGEGVEYLLRHHYMCVGGGPGRRTFEAKNEVCVDGGKMGWVDGCVGGWVYG